MEEIDIRYLKEDSKEKMDYFISLLSKQYLMYNACESKVNILATISAIFIGATIIFIDKKNIEQVFISDIKTIILNIGMILMLILFILSLAIMIWYVGPDKVINFKWVKIKKSDFLPNHRAIYGIKEFKNVIEYKNYISTITLKNICDQIINQIYVMNKMIWKIQEVIMKTVILNIIGLFIFLFIIYIYLFE